MAWKLVNPNITNDPSYLEPQITDHETRITNNTTSLAQIAKQPEQYGAKGDGITDDTTAIQNFINDCIANGYNMQLNKKYKTTSLITIDGLGNRISFIANGMITAMTNGFLIKNCKGIIRINLTDGGDFTGNNIGVKVLSSSSLKLDVTAKHYGGIVLKMGGNKQDNTANHGCIINLDASNGCYQALQHGDNISGKFQDWFGCYETIYDMDSLNGSVFQNSNDITVQHYENHFFDTTHSKDSLIINNCSALHFDNLAVGGIARNLVNFSYSHSTITKIFIINEDALNSLPLTTIGVYCSTFNLIEIQTLEDYDCKNHINIADTNTSSNYLVKYGFTTTGDPAQKSIVKNGVDLGLGFFYSYGSNSIDYLQDINFKGKTNASVFELANKTLIDINSTPSNFTQYKISYCEFVTADAKTGFPESQVGTLMTYYINNISLVYQTWRPTQTANMYFRNWDATNNVWLAWCAATPHEISRTVTYNHGSIPANSMVNVSMAFTGAKTTNNIIATPTYGMVSGLLWNANCDTDDTVSIRVYNCTASAITVNRSWRVTVLKTTDAV